MSESVLGPSVTNSLRSSMAIFAVASFLLPKEAMARHAWRLSLIMNSVVLGLGPGWASPAALIWWVLVPCSGQSCLLIDLVCNAGLGSCLGTGYSFKGGFSPAVMSWLGRSTLVGIRQVKVMPRHP